MSRWKANFQVFIALIVLALVAVIVPPMTWEKLIIVVVGLAMFRLIMRTKAPFSDPPKQ